MAFDSEELDALMMEIGHALNVWGTLEGFLAFLFYEASGIRPYTKSNAIFDTLVGFDTRLSVCDAAMANDATDLDDIERAIWCGLSARLRKFYKRRHAIAHFQVPFGHDEERWGHRISPFFTWGKENANRAQYLTRGQIAVRAQKFRDLADSVLWFAVTMRVRRTGKPIGELTSKEPRLIAHIRALALRNREGRE